MIKWNTEYFKVWDGKKFWTHAISVVNGIDEMYMGDVDDLIFLRNTFVKDIEDNDIFEGDIVHVDGHYYGDAWYDEQNMLVEYDDGAFNVQGADVYNYKIRIIGNNYEEFTL